MARYCSSSRAIRLLFAILVLAYVVTNFHLSNNVVVLTTESMGLADVAGEKTTQQQQPNLQKSPRYDYEYWPPLTSILDFNTRQVIGDPQFLLDFVIAGHGKCGTTSFADWLGSSSTSQEVIIPDEEMLDLTLGTPSHLIYRLYTELKTPKGKNVTTALVSSTTTSSSTSTTIPTEQKMKRGYKSPGEIRSPRSIRLLHKLFPKTVLIVGIRHPVLWFESLFNFKVQNLRPEVPSNFWGNPNNLIGKCPSYVDFYCVGTAKGLFHVHLAQLGKTTKGKEQATIELQERYPILRGNITQTSNPIFLFDIEQISSTPTIATRSSNSSVSSQVQQQLQLEHEQRLDVFHNDIQRLLGISTLSKRPPKRKPGKKLKNRKMQRSRDKHKIDICKPNFEPLRQELMKMSVEIADWLQSSGFVYHPHVTVSSRDYFIHEILNDHYRNDPCDKRNNAKT